MNERVIQLVDACEAAQIAGMVITPYSFGVYVDPIEGVWNPSKFTDGCCAIGCLNIGREVFPLENDTYPESGLAEYNAGLYLGIPEQHARVYGEGISEGFFLEPVDEIEVTEEENRYFYMGYADGWQTREELERRSVAVRDNQDDTEESVLAHSNNVSPLWTAVMVLPLLIFVAMNIHL